MSEQLITVGIPFVNNVDTLPDAIRSVFAQTYENWELILIDDGADDGSCSLAQTIEDPRVRVIRDGTNLGLPARLNQIHEAAQGTYCARMDADDIMHPERLERQLHFIRNHQEYDVVGTGVVSIDTDGTVTGMRHGRPGPFTAKQVLARANLAHASVFARTEWFRANRYDETFRRSQDQELWIRTFHTSRTTAIPEPLMFIREGGSLTVGKYVRSARAARTMLRRYGPEMIGKANTISMIAQSYAKELVYRSADLAGMVDKVVDRRSNSLTPEQYHAAAATLSEIRSIRIPGVAESATVNEGPVR